MARLWRATRVERFAIAEQAGAHEVGRGSISCCRSVRVQLQDQPRGRVAKAVLRGAQIDPLRPPTPSPRRGADRGT